MKKSRIVAIALLVLVAVFCYCYRQWISPESPQTKEKTATTITTVAKVEKAPVPIPVLAPEPPASPQNPNREVVGAPSTHPLKIELSMISKGTAEQPAMPPALTKIPMISKTEAEQTVVLQMIATNVSQSPLAMVHLRSGILERYGAWGGWEISIEGPGGKYEPVPSPGFYEAPMGNDVRTLQPGKSFSIRVDIRNMANMKDRVYSTAKYLKETRGDYAVSIRYGQDAKKIGAMQGMVLEAPSSQGKAQTVEKQAPAISFGPVSSNRVEFKIP